MRDSKKSNKINSKNKESFLQDENLKSSPIYQSETSLEYKKENDNEVIRVKGTSLNEKEKLFFDLQCDWIRNSIPNLRDTGRAIIGPIGFLLGFYGVIISIGANSGAIITKDFRMIQKLVGLMPPLFWMLSLFFILISTTPIPQKAGKSFNQIKKIFDSYTHRIRIGILLSLWLFFIGTLLFIIIIVVIVFW